MEINIDNIFKECLKKYPIGTKYYCASGECVIEYEVTSQSFNIPSDKIVYGETNKGCLYKNGNYAEIIEKSIPRYIKCIKPWNGICSSVLDKIYDTSEEQTFSSFSWKRILEGSVIGIYFIESTKQEFDNQNKPKPIEECVHVTTQEEFDFVYKKLDRLIGNGHHIADYGDCIIYLKEDEGFDCINMFDSYRHLKYSFKEWCKEFNHKFNFLEDLKVGDIVVVTEKAYEGNIPVDVITKILNIDNSDIPYGVEWINGPNGTSWCKNVRKANLQEQRTYLNKNTIIEKPKESKFKIGGFVQWKDNTSCSYKLLSFNDYGFSIEYLGDKHSYISKLEDTCIPVDENLASLKDYDACDLMFNPFVEIAIPLYSDIIEVKKLKTFNK